MSTRMLDNPFESVCAFIGLCQLLVDCPSNASLLAHKHWYFFCLWLVFRFSFWTPSVIVIFQMDVQTRVSETEFPVENIEYPSLVSHIIFLVTWPNFFLNDIYCILDKRCCRYLPKTSYQCLICLTSFLCKGVYVLFKASHQNFV